MTNEELLAENADLKRQLAGTAVHVKQFREMNAKMAGEMHGYNDKVRAEMEVWKRQKEQEIDLFMEHANRYRFLRQFRVQVWRLSIFGASGENLDRLTDEAIATAALAATREQ